MSPQIPQATRRDLLTLLRRLSTAPGAHSLRKWNYLAASVEHWNATLIVERQDDELDGERCAGDELPQAREREVSTLLSALPSYPFDADVREDSTCAVCQVGMRPGDMICRLPCSHGYHVGCIDTWLRVKTTCPLDNRCIAGMLEKLVVAIGADGEG